MSENTTTSRKPASNTVLLLRSTEEGLELVRAFERSDEIKSPATAAKKFVASLSSDDGELYDALLRGELSMMNGHLDPIKLSSKPVISVG